MRWGEIKSVMSILMLCGTPADDREGLEDCKALVLVEHCALELLGLWIEEMKRTSDI